MDTLFKVRRPASGSDRIDEDYWCFGAGLAWSENACVYTSCSTSCSLCSRSVCLSGWSTTWIKRGAWSTDDMFLRWVCNIGIMSFFVNLRGIVNVLVSNLYLGGEMSFVLSGVMSSCLFWWLWLFLTTEFTLDRDFYVTFSLGFFMMGSFPKRSLSFALVLAKCFSICIIDTPSWADKRSLRLVFSARVNLPL